VLPKYTEEQLMCATEASGLPVDDDFRAHMQGNFGNFNADADGIKRMDIFNMEGQMNEHLTSTGITDCVSTFSGRADNSQCPLIRRQRVCPTPDKNCGVPSRRKLDEFWDTFDVGATRDGFMSVEELTAKRDFFNNNFRQFERNEGAGGQIHGAHIFLMQTFADGRRMSKEDFIRVSIERLAPTSFNFDTQRCCALFRQSDENACFRANSCHGRRLTHTSSATCQSHQCGDGFLKTAPDNRICIGEQCQDSDCCEEIMAPPPVEDDYEAPAEDDSESLWEAPAGDDGEAPAGDDRRLQSSNITQDDRRLQSFNLGSTWEALGSGGCNDNGGVTHCKYWQGGGWHRSDIPTGTQGIAAARQACGEEASRLPSAIAAEYIHLWGWQFCTVQFPPGMGCPASIRGAGRLLPGGQGLTKGFYQEWVGHGGHGPIQLDRSRTGNHEFCFRKTACTHE